MVEAPRSPHRCDFCGGEFRLPDTARKDAWGNFYTIKGGYYLPFKCQHCRGTFCNEHRLPENHNCVKETNTVQPNNPPVINQPNNYPQYDNIEKLRPRIESEFSQGTYDRAVMKDSVRKHAKAIFLIVLILVGSYVATNENLVNDVGIFIQAQTSTITSTITSAISSINNNTSTTGRYKGYQLGLVKAPDGVISNTYGGFVVLINNVNAVNPTYSQLVSFLSSDKTDKYPYQDVSTGTSSYSGLPEDYVDLTYVEGIINGTTSQRTPRKCSDFAEMLHNNAERAGFRCAYVSIRLSGSGHALNAFDTTDRGIVYIDCTGFDSVSKPSSCDKVVDVLRVGSDYIPRSMFPEVGWSDVWGNVGTVTSVFVCWDGEWRK